MQSLIYSLLVLLATATPIPTELQKQQFLIPHLGDRVNVIPPPRPQGNFDAAANSVGVIFTQSTTNEDDEDVIHLWLPLGKKIYAHEHPILPGHPLTARVTTLINSSPEMASIEALDRIQCDIWTYRNMTAARGQEPERWKVSFSKKDGTVFFAQEGDRWWLGGKEMESVECF